ncbi:MAG: hypothetical protein ACXWV9_05855 [Flavisolibacter sp.]
MKDQSRAEIPIQYSGHPLSVADLTKQKKSPLTIVKTLNQETTFVQENEITNDPVNWDHNWFNNYE